MGERGGGAGWAGVGWARGGEGRGGACLGDVEGVCGGPGELDGLVELGGGTGEGGGFDEGGQTAEGAAGWGGGAHTPRDAQRGAEWRRAPQGARALVDRSCAESERGGGKGGYAEGGAGRLRTERSRRLLSSGQLFSHFSPCVCQLASQAGPRCAGG